MPTSAEWRSITALPVDIARQRSPRLIEQMKNRMAVETGIIEG